MPLAFYCHVASCLQSWLAILTGLGMPLEFYCHVASCAATLRKFVGAVDKRGEVKSGGRPPRALRPGEAALLELALEKEIALELEADCRHLGRVIIRSEGQTVGGGLVRAILK